MNNNYSNFFIDIKDKPKFVTYDNLNMVTLMGSRAYKTSTPESDYDYYGFLIPPIEYIFPHTAGVIEGFGKNNYLFNQFQAHHLNNDKEEVDITIYNITSYFKLCMNGNPNMIDSLFTEDSSIMYMDDIGEMVRKNRKLFLSQKCYHTFTGMMFSHLSRLKNRERIGKRAEIINKYGFDTKDASHIIRLLFEIKEILFRGELTLGNFSSLVIDVKNGGWTKEEVVEFAEKEMVRIQDSVNDGKAVVPYSADEKVLKELLIDCLEEKYGSLKNIGFPTNI